MIGPQRKIGQWRCPCGHYLEPESSPDSPPFRCESEGCVCAQCAGCEVVAFTVGNRTAYADLQPGVKKVGRHGPTEEEPSGYGGGIVFRTAGMAGEWIVKAGKPEYGMYRIGLPAPWEECVDETGDYPAILVDCLILGPA